LLSSAAEEEEEEGEGEATPVGAGEEEGGGEEGGTPFDGGAIPLPAPGPLIDGVDLRTAEGGEVEEGDTFVAVEGGG